MQPPATPRTGSTAPEQGAWPEQGAGPERGAATLAAYAILTQRADFIRTSNGARQGTPGFHLQARASAAIGIRVGFTCSKKVGNAVARNRAKRRLREVVRAVLPGHGRVGWDYVLVGRANVTATRDFRALQSDLIRALTLIHPA